MAPHFDTITMQQRRQFKASAVAAFDTPIISDYIDIKFQDGEFLSSA
jgi:hypothetical protein